VRAKIRQVKNSAKQKCSERYFMFSRKLIKKWDAFLRKGHEKMTIMFIPHNEKKIFNFQISKFIISFFIILFFIVVSASLMAFIKHNQIKDEEKESIKKYNNVRAQLHKFQELSSEIESLMEDIKPQVEKIYTLSTGTDDPESIWLSLPVDPEDQISVKNQHVPSQIEDLKEIRKNLSNAANTMKTVKVFLDERRKVANGTPSMFPNNGHITSLFGWRRSPFGFGRDFHYGIDIAADHGTPIKATAKGIVVFAGWSGGYGNMIRVKHDYGYETIYAHCSRLNVSKDQIVERGDVVGFVGQTGSSTGNHCHYEIRMSNTAVNPYPYMSPVW